MSSNAHQFLYMIRLVFIFQDFFLLPNKVPKSTINFGTFVTGVKPTHWCLLRPWFVIEGGVGYSSCRTTRSCIIGPYHQGCGPNLIEKDSQSARRANRSRQRQARLHTVEFGAEWPKASLLCGSQVTRVRIDGGVVYSFSSKDPTVINMPS